MIPAFVGIDVACGKGKRLPVCICTWQSDRLVPERLRNLEIEPPRGSGNAKTIVPAVASQFAQDAASYLREVSRLLNLRIERIAIDAPSAPTISGSRRRLAETALDRAGISCFATPTATQFEVIRKKVANHLTAGGPENRIPHANQLWMLVGFELFKQLSEIAPCIEVYPQATARMIGASKIHKVKKGGVEAQLKAAARHTGWPSEREYLTDFPRIGWAPPHDLSDAYLAAWVAALPEDKRFAYGCSPDDVIWTPLVDSPPTETLPPIRMVTGGQIAFGGKLGLDLKGCSVEEAKKRVVEVVDREFGVV